MVLNSQDILWSKGPHCNDYAQKETEHVSSKESILNQINNKIIWIRNTSKSFDTFTDLDIFVQNIDKLDNEVMLITSDGDRSVPSSYKLETVQKILNCDFIKYWYTQNYDRSIIHNKLKYIPIGLDLHTNKWLINNSIDQKLEYMENSRLHIIKENNILQIFCDAHLNITNKERMILYYQLKYNTNIVFLNKLVPFKEITQKYNKYHFALSPIGNGIDCHRTWELFLAGVIVIMKSTSLDNMFIDNNLPVVIINEWNELNHDLENKLKVWHDKYYPMTSIENIYPKFSYTYWISKS